MLHTCGDILEKRLIVLRHSALANGELQSRYDTEDILALTRKSFTPVQKVNEKDRNATNVFSTMVGLVSCAPLACTASIRFGHNSDSTNIPMTGVSFVLRNIQNNTFVMGEDHHLSR